MHALFSERKRGESAFTLIELLVVMIIIAILMAVAVPTFLKQKQNAVKSQATQNVKQVVGAIESCGQDSSIGSYAACDKAALEAQEPSLANITKDGTTYTVTVGANDYSVTVDVPTTASFTEAHTDNGAITKTCVSHGNAGKKVCPAGTW